MKIHLRPELEKIIEEDIRRGSYRTIEEYIERAVSLLHQQETWLTENRTEVAAQISEGFAVAQSGELLDADEVRSIMDQRKRAWLADKR